MTAPCLALLLSLTAAGNEQILDAFGYADSQAARQAWTAGDRTRPVETARENDRVVLQFTAPFATDTDLGRTVVDRNVDLNLAGVGQFTLDIAATHPEAVGQVSLYFRSGGGWYAGSGHLVKEGWQTLRFSKAAFRVEEKPAGWHKIDGIRISCWRGQAVDCTVRLGRLAAGWNDVALVVPAAYAHQDARMVNESLRAADGVGAMLGELGLGSDAIEDAAIAGGALGDRAVAVLACNPRLADGAVDALKDFVEAGGKLFACYQLPGPLADAIGIGRMRYVRPDSPGGLAEIRFDAADVPGLPQSVRQASWNITTAEPTGHNARVIGRWHDDAGKPTGHAAMLLSDRGAFFSHTVLSDDRSGKKQMLAAVLGRLHPPLWRRMAQHALAQVGRVGHCQETDEIVEYLKQTQEPATASLVASGLAAGLTSLDSAQAKFDEEAYPEAIRLARKSHYLLVEAYLKSQPSLPTEGRAWWNHSGTGAYSGDWDRSAKELAAAGFNMILPNMLWAGRAHYPSDVLPRSRTFEEHGDQIAQCVAACKKYGIEVHVWKVNWNLSGAPKEFVEKMRDQNRLQAFVGDERRDWLCPSHPENQKLELESMLEVARKYDVDGLHFDYIRYPGSHGCYCDGCRERFEAQTGRRVADWPGDCHSGTLRDAYRDWRCDQITRLVEAVHREAKKIKPEIKISAAVFGAYPACRQSVGQDWPVWIKAGYLDFVCPMDYTESDLSFSNLVANQLRLVDGRIPVYPGIGATATRIALTADRVVGQIHHARRLGAAGFTIFNLHERTAGEILPGVGLGATSQTAIPPHRTR